ncbi:ectonucleotide pyrophosphatase/phosphodiesterase family member 5-like [Convolutriloba macropyga]|uniref:ectonucleotide pyrophosphatase/phosphodiesterase family member 5-like n=1 Tax=Convolutriloba macropyga TaxID=536237 RepID=UPI003F525452
MVTGLYPESHGIVANTFYDRALNKTFDMYVSNFAFWNQTEPIWITAEKQNIPTILAHFPGSSVEEFKASYTYKTGIYEAPLFSFKYLIDKIFEAFNSEKNPAKFAIVYSGQPDNTGHKYGADDEFVIQKLIDIDFGIDYLLRKMSPNDNLIITADHGMASIDENLLLDLDELNKKSPIFDPNLTDSAIFDDPLILVYAKTGKLAELQINFEEVKKQYTDIQWYSRQEIPKRWHFSGNGVRSPDILGIVNEHSSLKDKISYYRGNHGWDNELLEMRPVFVGYGARFKKGFQYDGFVEMVDIYPLLADLIGLNYSSKDINGSFERVEPFLTSDFQHLERHIWSGDEKLKLAAKLTALILIGGFILVKLVDFIISKSTRARKVD